MIYLIFLFVSVLSYILIKILIKNAVRLNLLDIPNGRSYHCSIVPSGGGIGFVAAFFLSILAFKFPLFLEHWYVFVAILIVFLIGIVDDKYDVPPKVKFIFIFMAVFILWIYGLRIDTFGSWFGHDTTLTWWVSLPFSMFALAGFTNALNLIDGIDGLATSISIIIIAFFWLIGYKYDDILMMVLASFSIASLLGFLFLNWNPAKIFMGDSGSLTLGFIISILALISIRYIHPVFILYLAALPILDTLIVMIRRVRSGKSPFSPDKTHMHHILVKFFNNNVKKTVLFLIVLQTIFSSIGYILSDITNKDSANTTPFFALVIFVLMFLLFYIIFTGINRRQLALDKKMKD